MLGLALAPFFTLLCAWPRRGPLEKRELKSLEKDWMWRRASTDLRVAICGFQASAHARVSNLERRIDAD